MSHPNIDLIIRQFYINTSTGVVIRIKTGKPIGTGNGRGYLKAAVGRRTVLLHRIAWVLYYGVWPSASIDHINHCRTDNRKSNLRDVSVSANSLNAEDKKTKGVRIERSGNFTARLRGRHIGTFKTFSEAKWAYSKALRQALEGAITSAISG